MKKALIVAALILGPVVVANAQIDLGLSLGKDYVDYWYYSDEPEADEATFFSSSYVPTKIGVVFNLSLTDVFKLGLHAGYSTLMFSDETDYDDPNNAENSYSSYSKFSISGIGIGARGLAEVPLNNELMSLYGGLGLGFYSYSSKGEYHYEDADTSYTKDTEGPKLGGLGQTFIAGCHLGVSENFGINIELEGLGLSFMKFEDEDVDDDDYDDVDETWTSTWSHTPMTRFNDIGISVAIVFRF